jgi:tetratricopeptide (TPR) repeat protein
LLEAVRLIITFCCAWVLAATARADTIVLKNGDRIPVDSIQEHDGRVEYWVGDNSFTLPKSVVAKIEAGPPSLRTEAAPPEIEPPPVRWQFAATDQLVARVIHDGAVDNAALKAIEAEGVPEQSAAANALAANFFESKSNFENARHYLDRGLHFLPHHPVLLESYASVLLRLGRPGEALIPAREAVSADPASGEAFAILGFALYKNDRIREAIAAFKKSLDLAPSEPVRELLAKLERESRAEADFREQESSHFTLRYEGSETPNALRAQILDSLEDDYKDLQNDLGVSPRNIFVSLYTDEAFVDVTQAPGWSAALNDGKIRIPISGIKSVTPQLASVLRHELAHSFVQQITHGRVPQWLNEGIAQLEQGSTTSAYGSRLAALYASGNEIPLNNLEARFASYSASEASVAYAEALAATEYIRNTYGMESLARLLERLGEGQPIEAALRSTIHSGYADLESEITAYLKKNYGL